MRTQEETFYNLNRLHLTLAVWSLALLGVTIWMLAADHRREWKIYQRVFRDRVEPWLTEAQLSELATEEARDEKAQADHRASLETLRRTLSTQRPSLSKRLLRLPLIDALGRPLAIQQYWLPELTIDYNFCQVARFDRCTTCHQAIDKTLPGSPSAPACAGEKTLQVKLATPKSRPAPGATLASLYGFSLAPEGILDPSVPTVGHVGRETAAARAEILAGDVILRIDAVSVSSREGASERLLAPGEWSRPLVLELRRGLPQPYRSHPRLDLFVGSRSPHPAAEFGCTICHSGQGSATEFKFASHSPNDPGQRGRWQKERSWFWNHDWDLPMRPSRFVESGCLKCHHDVVDLEPTRRFPDPPAPKLLAGYHLVRENGCFGCHEIKGVGDAGRRIGPDLRLEPAGTLRKVGPSLRETAGKLDRAFIEGWLRQPSRFRTETRMPQFFGLHEHLDGPTLADARRLEAVEIRAVSEYLLTVSPPIVPSEPSAAVTAPPSVERGKQAFEIQGCLACHKHQDFPESKATQGPDLSHLGAKLGTPSGTQWLVRWLRDPVQHSPRTAMPNPLLGSAAPAEASDPAADIAAYLLSFRDAALAPAVSLVEADLDALALEYLVKTYARELALEYLRTGIPASSADCVQGDAVELIGPVTRDKKIRYVGRRTIAKRGCYGCHDIPGFEHAPPIGPALSDWGRKQESLLAFEQVAQFLARTERAESADADTAFFCEAVLAKRREGFLWQKLRAPRSFDYQKAVHKGFHEQLLMGRFSLTADQREAVITFVLGLVADPPAEKYVYQPDRQRRAIVDGRKVLDQYGCAQCHTLEMERWSLRFDPDEFEEPGVVNDYDFLAPEISAVALTASTKKDRRGLAQAEVVGLPRVDAKGRLLVIEGDEEDENGDPLPMMSFTLWEPAAINGQVWRVGGRDLLAYQHQVARKRPPWGGDFARFLYPRVLADAKARGATASEVEAWGWVPPPLVNEGAMVQPEWLFEYLQDPTVIRPAAVLRMPKYHLSPEEAGKLVDYFAATAGAEFRDRSDPSRRRARPKTLDEQALPRLDKALRLMIDRTTYCAKCHLIGDFGPGGENRTVLAPNLDQVGQRLQPEYVRRWLANPKSVLPHTAMPVNFPPTGDPMGQDLFAGSSLEQLQAVTDLLVGYDYYMKRRTSIRALAEIPEGKIKPEVPKSETRSTKSETNPKPQ